MVPARLSRRARTMIVGAVVALALPAAASAANSVAVTATPINKQLTTSNAMSTITVRNVTTRRLTGLTLSVPAPKGVQVTIVGAKRGAKVRALPALKAKAQTKVVVRVRRTAKGPTAVTLTPKVIQKRKVVGSGKLTVRKPVPKPPATLTGRYFWGSQYTLNGIQQYTLYFTAKNYVFTDDTDSAWPVCTAVTEDCKTYTYDPKTNRLMIDGKAATLTGNKLEWDGQAYVELGRAKAGTRWDTVLTHSNSSGICPLYCNYYTEHLTFRPDGTFMRSSVASGTGPAVDWAVVPDDQKGTYEIRADGTLRLAFANGTERIETVGLYPEDNGTYPANASAGAVLGGDGYFDIRD